MPKSSIDYQNLYRACLSNSFALLEEATILRERGHLARAFFLAFTAAEELSKALLVTDCTNDYVTESDFIASFRSHPKKIEYIEKLFAAVNAEPDPSSQDIRELTNRRMSSLYVDTASDNSPLVPQDRFTPEDVGHLIDALIGRYDQLLYAEWLNAPRIGSRALFK